MTNGRATVAFLVGALAQTTLWQCAHKTAPELRGVVLGVDGQPASGARVCLTELNGLPAQPLACVDPSLDGNFQLSSPPGALCRVWISAAGFQRNDFPIVFPPAPAAVFLTAVVPREAADQSQRKIIFDKAHAYLGDFIEIADRFRSETAAFDQAYDRYLKEKGTNANFSYDLSAVRDYLSSKMSGSVIPEVKQFAAMHLVQLEDFSVKLDPDLYTGVIQTTPGSSAMWGLNSTLVNRVATHLNSAEAKSFLEAILRENRERKVQAYALVAATKQAYRIGDQPSYVSLHRRLKKDFGDVKEVRFDTRLTDPDNRIARGKQVPDFQLSLLDGAGTVSKQTLLGGFCLIDFWATWCGPCVAEMPRIAHAFDRYRSHNFTILSISLDEEDDAVRKFRVKNWPMPWLNGFIRSGAEALAARKLHHPLTADFEVDWIGLPRAVLVSPSGVILATQDELRGDNLDQTLQKYLGPSTSNAARAPLLDEANVLLDHEDWEAAARAYRAILREQPYSGMAWAGLARSEKALHNYQAAKDDYQRAVELSFEKDASLYQIARLSALVGDADQAFQHLGAALKAGFRAPWIAWEKDLQSLKQDRRWSELFPDPTAEFPELSQPTFRTRVVSDAAISMRDGVVLLADIDLPEEPGNYPAILARTPYGRKNEMKGLKGEFWTKRGYVFVVQDVRGRNGSGGIWEPYLNETDDGYDTIEWISRQPWSNGKVGMIGGSYLGSVQWQAASAHPPALKCIIPQVSGTDPFFNTPYDHGVFLLDVVGWAGFVAGVPPKKTAPEELKTLPLSKVDDEYLGQDVPFFDQWLEMETPAAFSRANFLERLREARVPALQISGWWDGNGSGTQRNWEAMHPIDRKNQWLIEGPWGHNFNTSASMADAYYGPTATLNLDALYVRWFDHWLKGRDVGLERVPRAEIFVTGVNEWRSFRDWPDPRSREMTLYLRSSKPNVAASGKGELASSRPVRHEVDEYDYDPTKVSVRWSELPYPWFGTTAVKWEDDPNGSLLYRTEILPQPLEIGGPISLELYFSTTARDLDFFASLIDIDGEGAMHVINQPGMLRARYVSGWNSPRPLEPRRIYRAVVQLGAIAHQFQTGHRMALLIRSHMFPLYARNLGTGEPIKDATRMLTGRQSILHDPRHPSALYFRRLPPP